MLTLRFELRHSPGDFRMYFGENPDKVKNIVTSTLGKFQELYAPALKVWQSFFWLRSHRREGSGFRLPPRIHPAIALRLHCFVLNAVKLVSVGPVVLLCTVPSYPA